MLHSTASAMDQTGIDVLAVWGQHRMSPLSPPASPSLPCQACWDDTGLRPRQQHSFRCRFLHSPLLDELKALELVVESQFGPRQTASRWVKALAEI